MLLAPVTQADTITTDGTVIENQTFNSTLQIKAHNVTIRNCVIDVPTNAPNWYSVTNVFNNDDGTPKSTNLRIENCTIRGASSAAVYIQHGTLIGCDIQEVGTDAIKVSTKGHSRIINNYVARIGKNGPPGHADALQMTGGSHVFIVGNHFDIPVTFADENGYLSNACIIIASQYTELHDIYIWNNHFNGGNYTVYIRDKYPDDDVVGPYRIRFNNNTFGTDYRYGALSWTFDPTIQVNWNHWDDGTPMNTGQWDINTWDMWPNW